MLGMRIRKTRCQPERALKSPVKSSSQMTLSPLHLSPKKRTTKSKPSSPLGIAPLTLSPSKRTTPCRRKLGLSTADTAQHKAVSEALNTSVPDQLLCRQRQIDDISDFISTSVSDFQAGSLYISGAPGTGKTACLQKVLADPKLKSVKQVWVNCMSLKSTSAIYSHLISKLCGKQVSMTEREAKKILEKKLTSGDQMILILLDEIDHLEGKNQEILYTLFEWPVLKHSRLVLIGIANALDLTDRLLPRLTSRLKVKPTLLHFPPYSKQEIVDIIKARLDSVPGSEAIISSAAVHLLAGKVAAVAGDARKALAVCRRSVEVVERLVRRQVLLEVDDNVNTESKKPSSSMVGPAVILQVFNEVYQNVVVQQCQNGTESFPIHQKLSVCSLLLMLKNGKSKDAPLGRLHETYSRVCKSRHVIPVSQSEFCSLLEMVQARGIISIKSSKEVRQTKLSLMLDESELVTAMQDKELLASILRDNSCFKK